MNEGFPNAILESMILGLPVISTNCDTGPSELINQENTRFDIDNYLLTNTGILCPVIHDYHPFDLNKISRNHLIYKNAIMYLLKNRKSHEEISINSKISANEFKKENVTSLYIKFIEEVFLKGG
jgi:N-acetylgalactosamine-N,N'-diacetylbacillosaminyl-diphospho-undecaprenol 4-alpha-N-acetylgalactosaminyltransferase